MKPISHLVLSTVGAAGVFCATRSWEAAASSFIAGTLIDLDHVPDYIREYGFRIDVGHFFEVFRRTRFRRVSVVLHGWEWISALASAMVLTGSPVVTGAFVGATLHLITDQLFNSSHRWTYFFFWRMIRGFRTRECFPLNRDA